MSCPPWLQAGIEPAYWLSLLFLFILLQRHAFTLPYKQSGFRGGDLSPAQAEKAGWWQMQILMGTPLGGQTLNYYWKTDLF